MTNTCQAHGSPAARSGVALLSAGLFLAIAACQPSVKVEAPDEPIVINLNIKIEQEVRVKIDRALDDAISDNPSIFE
ncbi:MAG: YnbE family lipoprotein [Alphaproteobacteria bacterium]|nr:YnbE family lipoprotein [Alphaproteobacteria bacterium]